MQQEILLNDISVKIELFSFSHPHVPNLYEFLSSVERKIRYSEECW